MQMVTDIGKRELLESAALYAGSAAVFKFAGMIEEEVAAGISLAPESRAGILEIGRWFLFLMPLFLGGLRALDRAFGSSCLIMLRCGSRKRFWLMTDSKIGINLLLYLLALGAALGDWRSLPEFAECGLLISGGYMLMLKLLCLLKSWGMDLTEAFAAILVFYGGGIFWLSDKAKAKLLFPAFWMMRNCSCLESDDGFSVGLVLAVQLALIMAIQTYLLKMSQEKEEKNHGRQNYFR